MRIIILLFILSNSIFGQIIQKPVGCFAGTNGTNPLVLAHNDVRGVLLIEKWSEIEKIQGEYDFTSLNSKIEAVKSAGLKYSLAIAGGAFGSPSWLIDSLNVTYQDFDYQGKSWRLPLWWDPTCDQKLTSLINELGVEYGSDSELSHIYVTQMTVNGIEGHLNGVDIPTLKNNGFSNQIWINAAKKTVLDFMNAFPDKPIVFEIHEIDRNITIPVSIITDLTNDPNLCSRFGLGMWWISGKTTYQSDLIDFISEYEGDKYAQIIGRSDQIERFEDDDHSNVFAQAKSLGIRYIEPWPYEFQHNTYDNLMADFNEWADNNFQSSDTCLVTSSVNEISDKNEVLNVHPNPAKDYIQLQIDKPLQLSIINITGAKVKDYSIVADGKLNVANLNKGIYFVVDEQGNNIARFVKE